MMLVMRSGVAGGVWGTNWVDVPPSGVKIGHHIYKKQENYVANLDLSSIGVFATAPFKRKTGKKESVLQGSS